MLISPPVERRRVASLAIPDAASPLLLWLIPSPSLSVFRAALTSRSCCAPQALQSQALTFSPAKPVGPVRAEHAEQRRVEFRDGTSMNCAPPERHL